MNKYTSLTCSQCGTKFNREVKDVKSAINKNCENFYCSKECMKEHRSKEMLVKCDNCGMEFMKKLNQIKKTKRHFCTRNCSTQFRKK